MGSLSRLGGRLPRHKPKNTELHLWKYVQKYNKHTRMVRNQISMLNLKLLAKLLDHFSIQILSIIYNELAQHTVAVNDILFQKRSITTQVMLLYEAASTHLVKQSMATKIYSCPFEAFRIIGLMKSIPQAEKGHCAVREFRGWGGTFFLF